MSAFRTPSAAAVWQTIPFWYVIGAGIGDFARPPPPARRHVTAPLARRIRAASPIARIGRADEEQGTRSLHRWLAARQRQRQHQPAHRARLLPLRTFGCRLDERCDRLRL